MTRTVFLAAIALLCAFTFSSCGIISAQARRASHLLMSPLRVLTVDEISPVEGAAESTITIQHSGS